MTTAGAIVAAKPDQTIYTTTPHASIFDAASLMADANIGALIVMEADAVVGMVSERDFVLHAQKIAQAPVPLTVREIMRSPVQMVRADQTSEECMALMTSLRHRHLPVCSDRTLRGVVSVGDLVRHVIEEQRFTIQQLGQYIVS
jgi:CBS domain-containing protein